MVHIYSSLEDYMAKHEEPFYQVRVECPNQTSQNDFNKLCLDQGIHIYHDDVNFSQRYPPKTYYHCSKKYLDSSIKYGR